MYQNNHRTSQGQQLKAVTGREETERERTLTPKATSQASSSLGKESGSKSQMETIYSLHHPFPERAPASDKATPKGPPWQTTGGEMAMASSKSEDILGEKWDRCVADTLIKIGGGLTLGVVFSAIVFKSEYFLFSFLFFNKKR
ncbi:putative mitochondrial inner membrane organizing system protein 1-like [Penaeus vannamei]|uniref:MICOS complex subunit MIC10 n=1 Tax=Penaeus vannamei TaxID=6689 RepID=A0A3R7M3X0_PENVA|nr:putative mitochondrial inner membrane organizing system protein 1-like [Penaeus vannamei]